MKPLLPAFIVLSLLFASASRADLPAPDQDDGALLLPSGFRAVVVADNLVTGRKIGNNSDRLRYIAVAPNGDIYAKTYHGGIFALRDTDGDGRADVKEEFGSGGGTGLALQDGWIYHSTNSAVYRYRYTPGELVPHGEPELVVSGLPDEKNTHNAKAFAFDDQGRLLVEVGCSFNVYSDGDRGRGAKGKDATEYLKTRGGFWRFDAKKLNQTQVDGYHFSTGHRHSVAVAWNPTSKSFFMAMMGRDQLNTVAPQHYNGADNAECVAEEFHRLREGLNPGWPYTYYDPVRQARMLAPEFGGDGEKRAEPGKYDDPVIAFPAHWAPLQMAFYTGEQFPEKYRGGLFIAFHGSWNRAPKNQGGYKVVFVPFDEAGLPRGDYETFADGFSGKIEFASTREARYRPAGVAVGPDGSLYISDSQKGRIWRVFYTRTTASRPATTATATSSVATATPPSAQPSASGARVYATACAICHMADGTGVPNLQPPLTNSSVVSGDPALLINVILRGPAQVLPANRARYANVMPPHPHLSDNDIADVLSYIRASFGNNAPAITPAQVATQRAKP